MNNGRKAPPAALLQPLAESSFAFPLHKQIPRFTWCHKLPSPLATAQWANISLHVISGRLAIIPLLSFQQLACNKSYNIPVRSGDVRGTDTEDANVEFLDLILELKVSFYYWDTIRANMSEFHGVTSTGGAPATRFILFSSFNVKMGFSQWYMCNMCVNSVGGKKRIWCM